MSLGRNPSRPKVRRDFAPYRPPSLFGDAPAASPPRPASRPIPPQPPTQAPPPRDTRFPPILCEGEVFDLVEYRDDHLPGIAGLHPRRVLDFRRGLDVVARVVTYPDGPECRCPDWEATRECKHVLALVMADRLPELARLDRVELAGGEGGGA